MCGLTGIFGATNLAEPLHSAVNAMTQSLAHRGPDDGALWLDPEAGIGLGHRRLSIIDLSPAGHQPMVSACGRFVIAYNGEVYNAGAVRAAVPDVNWRGHSDTEAILEHAARHGIADTLSQLIGMFAIALWDRHTCTLWLARDRFGIKPLYWGRAGGAIVFASELKALCAHPDFRRQIDHDSVAAFLRFTYVPAPRTIWADAWKVPPGHLMTLRSGQDPTFKPFWQLREVARHGRQTPFEGSDTEAVEALDTLLKDAVGRSMVADVPLGAFLSGGVDSSTVVALMQAQSERPVKTFSIGFADPKYDEAPHARAVAAHLRTEHTELYVDPAHALAIIPKIPDWYDEPFADSSQIPTFLVSEMTRTHVTVALSGDGGDELFAGYERYRLGERLWSLIQPAPQPLRLLGARALTALPPATWDRLLGAIPGFPLTHPGDKMSKLAAILTAGDPGTLYRRLITAWDDPGALVPGAAEPASIIDDALLRAEAGSGFTEQMQLLDGLTYLPDDILTKVDRASMAVSLEARVPLLDHRVAAFAWSLPRHMRIRNGQSKWLLRQLLYRYVPRGLIDRPKMGFGIPVGDWLRGPLADWADTLLSAKELSRDGLLHAAPIRIAWEEHRSGRRDWTVRLWTVLMLQAWRARWTR